MTASSLTTSTLQGTLRTFSRFWKQWGEIKVKVCQWTWSQGFSFMGHLFACSIKRGMTVYVCKVCVHSTWVMRVNNVWLLTVNPARLWKLQRLSAHLCITGTFFLHMCMCVSVLRATLVVAGSSVLVLWPRNPPVCLPPCFVTCPLHSGCLWLTSVCFCTSSCSHISVVSDLKFQFALGQGSTLLN